MGLPRATQALEGYRNLAPPPMRLPTPWAAFIAIIGAMLAKKLVIMVLGLLMQWDLLCEGGGDGEPYSRAVGTPSWYSRHVPVGCYHRPVGRWKWRPKQDQRLRRGHHPISPHGLSDECHRPTAEQQDELPIALSLHLHPTRRAVQASGLRRERGPPGGDPLWEPPRRGHSDMRLRGMGIAEIKRRGRWMADSSLRRYEKATVAQQQYLKVPARTRMYASFVEQLSTLGPLLSRSIQQPSLDNLERVRQAVLPLPDPS